jgi:hypothetical protein
VASSQCWGRDGELPARFGRPVWNRPNGGLLATTAGTLVIVNTVNIEGISLMGSAGFLIIFAAVNLAAARLVGTSGRARVLARAGALACTACLAGLIAYAAARIPAQLAGLIAAAAAGEAIVRLRGRPAAAPPYPRAPGGGSTHARQGELARDGFGGRRAQVHAGDCSPAASPALLPAGAAAPPGGGPAADRSTSTSRFTAGGSGGSP